MNKMYILIGVPGCGKSTWAKDNIDKETVVVCKDAFRNMLRINYEFNPRYEKIVKDLQKAAIISAVVNGFNIIVDETNIKKSKRHDLKLLLEEDYFATYEVVYVVFRDTNTIDRRMKESRGYSREEWEEVIRGMVKDMEWPEAEECDEIIYA